MKSAVRDLSTAFNMANAFLFVAPKSQQRLLRAAGEALKCQKFLWYERDETDNSPTFPALMVC